MIERAEWPRPRRSGGQDRETVHLVRRARAGDVHAFAALAAGQHGALERFACRLMGDPDRGADLVQETLLRAHQSIGRLGPPTGG